MRIVHGSPSGGVGTQIWSGQITSFDPNSVTAGDLWYGTATRTGVVQKMRFDGHVRQSQEYIISPLLLADWTFLPDGTDPIALETAEFCKHVYFSELDFSKILRRIVRGYSANGFHIEEPVEKIIDVSRDRYPHHVGEGVGVGYRDWHDRPAWSVYQFFQQPEYPDRLDHIVQQLPGSDTEESGHKKIPASRLVRFTWDQEGGNFEGLATLRSAYGPWMLKQQLQVIDAIKHEREGVGTPTATLGENAKEGDIDKLATSLAQLRTQEQGYLIVPHGYEFDWKAGGGGSDLNTAIARCNIDIAFNVAAGFMNLGLTGKVGSFALGGTQQGQHHMYTSAHAKFIESVFNHGADGWSPVRRMVELNFGPNAPVPKLKATNLPTRNWQEVAKTIAMLVQSGVVTGDMPTENRLRQAFDMPELDLYTARQRPGAVDNSQGQDTEAGLS